jgi:hypothetical protein
MRCQYRISIAARPAHQEKNHVGAVSATQPKYVVPQGFGRRMRLVARLLIALRSRRFLPPQRHRTLGEIALSNGAHRAIDRQKSRHILNGIVIACAADLSDMHWYGTRKRL